VIGIRWLVTSLGSGLLLGRESRGDLTERVTTRPDFGCCRLVEAEDDPFVVFQSRCQLSLRSWVLVGML
jgi:hypothetical protein